MITAMVSTTIAVIDAQRKRQRHLMQQRHDAESPPEA